MSLIVLDNGSLAFAGQQILSEATVAIGEREKIGLIGPNGSGKSTLMKILLGQQSLDTGVVRKSSRCHIGYLPQDVLELAGDTLIQSVLAAVPGRRDTEDDLHAVEAQLAESTDPDEQMTLAEHLVHLHERLDHYETFYSERRAQIILAGLGFSETDFARPTREFSGGWKMRGALAGLLFRDPDVLFLDEPTNHLDVPSVRWLDEFLHQLKASLVLICHDRLFLNRHIDRVVSFEPEGLRSYRGNYDAYLVQRAEEETILAAEAKNRDRKVRELERFVERFRAKATKARQAQSRAKQLDKIQAEIDEPIIRPRRLSFRFPPTQRSGKDVISLREVGKQFGERVIYRQVTRNVYAGDRVAIVGRNGVGKTTLLKLIAGELTPDHGTIRFGVNVQPGYYAQHHTELLHPKSTVLEEVWRSAKDRSQSYVRGVCGSFLFSDDSVEKHVQVLSGGERARVLLARLLVNPGNLLLMDEPTNHLDLHAADALADALASFDGTLVFVSHNLGFANRLATKVWDVADNDIIEYLGNLDDYFRLSQVAEQQSTTKPSRPALVESPDQKRTDKRRQAEERNARNRKLTPLKDEIAALEERIEQLENSQKVLEQRLADPEMYQKRDLFRESLSEFDRNKAKLDELYARWQHKQEQLAEISAEAP